MTERDDDCLDAAVTASHAAGPVFGAAAEGATVAAAFAEAENPPAAWQTFLLADGAYQTGHHVGEAVGAPVFAATEYAGCETANFLNEEAHHAAHWLHDLFEQPASEPPPADPVAPAWSPDMGSSAPDHSFGGGLFSSLFDSPSHSAFDSFGPAADSSSSSGSGGLLSSLFDSPSHSAFDSFASPSFDSGSASSTHDSFSSGFGTHDGGSHGGHDSGTGMGGDGVI